jgi:hypothetical protein
MQQHLSKARIDAGGYFVANREKTTWIAFYKIFFARKNFVNRH